MIDVERSDAVKETLRRYPGCLLVRAPFGRETWTTLFPVAARYGAVPVPRCRPEVGPTECRAAIRDLIVEVKMYGFTKDAIVIDLSPGESVPQPEAIRTALDLISWCADSVGCRTLLDVTGIGRGLPEPQWLQASILAAAQAAGLTLAIADPALKELMQIRAAGDLLRGR